MTKNESFTTTQIMKRANRTTHCTKDDTVHMERNPVQVSFVRTKSLI